MRPLSLSLTLKEAKLKFRRKVCEESFRFLDADSGFFRQFSSAD